MAIPKMTGDVEVISKLGDVPGSDDGLSTQQLKGKFDLAAVMIKNFINDVLIPAIENFVDEDSLLSQISGELSKKLSLSGGTMTGAVNMNGKRLYNIITPTDAMDATPKNYVDSAKEEAMNFAKTTKVNATLTASGWSASAPYTQSLQIEGLTDNDFAEAYPEVPDDAEQEAELAEQTQKITSCKRKGNTMTFRCLEEKPELDIPVVVEVHK